MIYLLLRICEFFKEKIVVEAGGIEEKWRHIASLMDNMSVDSYRFRIDIYWIRGNEIKGGKNCDFSLIYGCIKLNLLKLAAISFVNYKEKSVFQFTLTAFVSCNTFNYFNIICLNN